MENEATAQSAPQVSSPTPVTPAPTTAPTPMTSAPTLPTPPTPDLPASGQTALLTLIVQQQEKIDKIYSSVEKTRKYFMWTLILTVLLVVVPGIILAFIAPKLSGIFTGNISSLGL